MGKKLTSEERQRREAQAEAKRQARAETIEANRIKREAQAEAKRQARAETIEANRIKREAIEAEIQARRESGTLQPTTLKDICFPVEINDNPRNTNQEYSKVVTGFIGGEEVDLNYCSPRYELVPNETIFPKVEEILNQHGIAFTAEYTHIQNARFYGNFTIEDNRFSHKMKGTNDVIKFIWNFQHSYNGLTKYKGVAGFYRLVCENGLVIPVQEMKEYNLEIQGKHTAAIVHSLADFSQILTNVTSNLGEVKQSIVQKYELLGGRMLKNPQDRIEEVLKANKIAIIDDSKFNTLNDIQRRISNDVKKNVGYSKTGINDWLVYNGINQYLNDNSRNIAAPEKRRETDSKVLEYMLEYA